MIEVLVFFIAVTFLYVLARVISRPRWPVHKHYALLEQTLVDRPRTLLTSDAAEGATGDVTSADYTISLDHINKLGFLTYVLKVTRHDVSFLPQGATCEEFAPFVPQQNNQPYYNNTDLVIFRRRFSVTRPALIRAMFASHHAEDVLRRATSYNSDSLLKELQHDDRNDALTFVFYLKPRKLGLKRGSKPEEFLAQAADAYDRSITAALSYQPLHKTTGSQWAELYKLLSHSRDDERAEVLAHILAHHDREPEVSELCKRVIVNGPYTDRFVLFRHDPERFFGAISPGALKRFVLDYVRESESFLTGPRSITPERLPEVFGAHLPFDVILNTKLPTIYRVELVRWWLAHDTRDRDALHEAIAAMSKRDQLQLRAALETDDALSGALSSIDEQGGKLTLEP